MLAYNLGNFRRRLVLPKAMRRWSLTSLREKLVKIGARLTRHARRLVLQMAEAAVTPAVYLASKNKAHSPSRREARPADLGSHSQMCRFPEPGWRSIAANG